jgi:hypothetical protein
MSPLTGMWMTLLISPGLKVNVPLGNTLIRLDLDTHVFVWRGAALASGVSYARKN